MKRFPWLLTILTVALTATLLVLGVWQVQRMQWKAGLIAASDAAAARAPVPLDQLLASGEPTEFRRVILACPGLATAPYVELRTIRDSKPGVNLVSVCQMAGVSEAVMVDRGFIGDTQTGRPRVLDSTLPTVFVAELRQAPAPGRMTPAPEGRLFYGRDNAAMAQALGHSGPVRAETLYAVTATNPELPVLQTGAPPAAFSNNHFGYALTWFGLAIALIGFYVALLCRRPGRVRAHGSDTPASDES